MYIEYIQMKYADCNNNCVRIKNNYKMREIQNYKKGSS